MFSPFPQPDTSHPLNRPPSEHSPSAVPSCPCPPRFFGRIFGPFRSLWNGLRNTGMDSHGILRLANTICSSGHKLYRRSRSDHFATTASPRIRQRSWRSRCWRLPKSAPEYGAMSHVTGDLAICLRKSDGVATRKTSRDKARRPQHQLCLPPSRQTVCGPTYPNEPRLFSDDWWTFYGWFMKEVQKQGTESA